MSKLKMLLFEKRPKVGGIQLWPMTGGRVAILEEKGNALVSGGEEITISRFEIMEAFLVVALGPEELAEKLGLDDAAWRREVNLFSLGEAGDLVAEFGEMMREEFDRIRGAMAEPKKKAARTGGSRRKATSRSSG